MKEIPLTKGYVAIVDDEDYEALSAFKWCAHVTQSGNVYARRKNKENQEVSMHRQLAGVPGLVVDHINGNGLDNRRENLRAVSHTLNMQNRTRPTRAATGERNIYQHKDGAYVVRCMRFGVEHYGGHFWSIEEARTARNALLESLEPNA